LKAVKWPSVASLNPWIARRKKRLEQYLETERHECRDAIERHRKDRDEKERQVQLDLFNEPRPREGSNWLENREMRLSAVMLDYQRTLITAQIDIRKKLAAECPDLLADTELSKLEETMLRSVQTARQARREDYTRRAAAAGRPIRRPEQSDAAAFGGLEELARREIRKLALARSLGRMPLKPPSKLFQFLNTFWNNPVWSKVIAAAFLALVAALFAWLKQWRIF
jgi:hypothetical protein